MQILEVSRERAKRFGLNLTDYALGGIFSPEQAPGGSTTPTGGTARPRRAGVAHGAVERRLAAGLQRQHDLHRHQRRRLLPGGAGGDRPLPRERLADQDRRQAAAARHGGQKVTLNLGEEVPVPSTTFTPLAQGGAAANPLTSFTYRPIGVIVEMTPRVTYEGDIVMDLTVENSARGQDSNIAGQTLPAFASRKVTTRLRLRDGESNLLAGLLREDERRSLRGFPGIMRVPLLQQLFADNDTNIRQTDIVMLLTPRIVRSHQLTASDLSPIYIGTQSNMAVGGPPPIFGGGGEPAAAAPVPPAAAPGTPAAPRRAGSRRRPALRCRPPRRRAVAPQVPLGQLADPGNDHGALRHASRRRPPAAPPSGIVTFPPPAPAPAARRRHRRSRPRRRSPAPPQRRRRRRAWQPGHAAVPPAPATVLLSPPGTEFRVGGGPYLVPMSISGRVAACRPCRCRSPSTRRCCACAPCRRATCMRQGGVQAAFTQKIDAAAGRVDIAVVRPGDVLGRLGHRRRRRGAVRSDWRRARRR